MKGEINMYGALSIERAGKMRYQDCPHQQGEDNGCGDWCPMFREPEVIGPMLNKIEICNNTLFFNKFEDKR